jgi:hypothetical protein
MSSSGERKRPTNTPDLIVIDGEGFKFLEHHMEQVFDVWERISPSLEENGIPHLGVIRMEHSLDSRVERNQT